MTDIYKKLAEIQKTLNVPKSQYNSFSKFYYRSCEDILEAIKPLLDGYALIITDDVVNVGNRNYVKATVILTDGKETISNSALAREEETKKGMDGAQITGSSSSYARKYALNGLFAIDDTKDADTQDNTKHAPVADEPLAFMYDINTAIDACTELFDSNNDQRLVDVLNGLEDAKLGKRNLSKKYVTQIRDRAKEKLKEAI